MKGKFVLIPGEMLGDKRLKPLDVVVYGALDSFADNGGDAWPSIPTIAERSGVSSATVKRALSRLESAGYIVRQRRCRPGTKEFDSTFYTLSFRGKDDGSAIAEVGSDVYEVSSGMSEVGSVEYSRSAHSVQKVGSGVSEVGSAEYRGSAPSIQKVGSDRPENYTHRTIPNELYSAGENTPADTHPASDSFASGFAVSCSNDTRGQEPDIEITGQNASVENSFNELWERYPRKNAKGEAKKAFMALFTPDMPLERIKQRLGAISEQFVIFEQEAERLIERGEEHFIPYLHNWLVREGFADA